ncbi:hypothetical protein Tco_1197990 [Tanacetum coccineum]
MRGYELTLTVHGNLIDPKSISSESNDLVTQPGVGGDEYLLQLRGQVGDVRMMVVLGRLLGDMKKTASIIYVEDKELFCRDYDEPIHSAGTLAANNKRFLSTWIHVALTSSSTQEPEKNQQDHPPPPVTENNVAAIVPQFLNPLIRKKWCLALAYADQKERNIPLSDEFGFFIASLSTIF